jgi:hypothetical protein
MQFPSANEGYSVRAIFAQDGDEMTINTQTGSTAGTDAFTAGTAQVETATIVAAGGAASNGNLALVVTAAGMTGSPLTVNVALTTAAHANAALIAAACREALTANAAVAALFTVGGTSAAITLTRKPVSTFTVPGGTLNLYTSNDATLNIAIPTALGVTGASSSTDTTAGVASAGVKLYDAGVNFEGNPIAALVTAINGVAIKCNYGGAEWVDSFAHDGSIQTDGVFEVANKTNRVLVGALTITANTTTDITITVIGQTA